MVDKKPEDETSAERQLREQRERQQEQQAQQQRQREGRDPREDRTVEDNEPSGGKSSRTRVSKDDDDQPDFDTLPLQTQEEIKAGQDAAKLAADAQERALASGKPVPGPNVGEATQPATTEEPGSFIGQESSAAPVGTEPNPPEGVTVLTHEPIENVPITERVSGADEAARQRQEAVELAKRQPPPGVAGTVSKEQAQRGEELAKADGVRSERHKQEAERQSTGSVKR